jgi:hypothetical protein
VATELKATIQRLAEDYIAVCERYTEALQEMCNAVDMQV